MKPRGKMISSFPFSRFSEERKDWMNQTSTSDWAMSAYTNHAWIMYFRYTLSAREMTSLSNIRKTPGKLIIERKRCYLPFRAIRSGTSTYLFKDISVISVNSILFRKQNIKHFSRDSCFLISPTFFTK